MLSMIGCSIVFYLLPYLRDKVINGAEGQQYHEHTQPPRQHEVLTVMRYAASAVAWHFYSKGGHVSRPR